LPGGGGSGRVHGRGGDLLMLEPSSQTFQLHTHAHPHLWMLLQPGAEQLLNGGKAKRPQNRVWLRGLRGISLSRRSSRFGTFGAAGPKFEAFFRRSQSPSKKRASSATQTRHHGRRTLSLHFGSNASRSHCRGGASVRYHS